MNRKIASLILAASTLTALCLTSCDKTESGPVPMLTVSTGSIGISSIGGGNSLTYTVLNSTDDGTVSCVADAEWITGIDCSAFGTVTFSVSENTGIDVRTGHLTLTYDSSSGSASQTVIVVQNIALTPGFALDPAFVTAPAEGGSISFSYSVFNVDGGSVTAISNVDWIDGVELSESAGTVSFTLDANSGSSVRAGSVILTWTDGTLEFSAAVTVAQDHPGGLDPLDASRIVGTYIATGPAMDWNFEQATWTMKIFDADGFEYFDFFIDGLTPYLAGRYDEYGDTRVSACAYYWHGAIVIPTQVRDASLEGTYYLGYTACLGLEDNTFYYSPIWPSVIFTYDSETCTWTSDYGVIVIGTTTSSTTAFQSFAYYYDITLAPVTLTQISSSTDISSTETEL